MVRIIPQRKTFQVEIVYRANEKQADVDPTKYANIDPGVSDLCPLFCQDGTIIWDGKFVKSYNRNYNNRLAQLRSVKDKTKRLVILHDHRNIYIDAFHKISLRIVDYLVELHIGNLVVGKNKVWKQNEKMGKMGNQRFVQIPHGDYMPC